MPRAGHVDNRNLNDHYHSYDNNKCIHDHRSNINDNCDHHKSTTT